MTTEPVAEQGDATPASSDASKELRAAFRDHLQITGIRDAYDRLLATTRLLPKFEDGGDSKVKKVVSLQHTDGRVLYRLELYRWALLLSICEPAQEAWRQRSDAAKFHFFPRFVGVDDNARASLDEDKDDDDRTLPGLRIISVADVRDVIDFARSTDYPL